MTVSSCFLYCAATRLETVLLPVSPKVNGLFQVKPSVREALMASRTASRRLSGDFQRVPRRRYFHNREHSILVGIHAFRTAFQNRNTPQALMC